MQRSLWQKLFGFAVSPNAVKTQSRSARPRSVRPCVEQLEDRTTPSMLDLTTVGAAGQLGGAVFEQLSLSSGGTGKLHPFVRLQAHGHNTVEQGYNTDARPVQFDEKSDPTFTHSVQLDSMPTVTINGAQYRVFVLGINQTHKSPYLSLDDLKVYVGTTGNLTGFDPTTGQLAGLTPVFDLSAGGAANWIKLNANLSHGNGSSDMVMFLPDSLFAGATGNPYVYLYSKFGVNFAANGGFEQWAAGTANITAPATIGGTVYQDNNTNLVFDTGDTGVAGIVLTLTGTNSQGQQVNLTTTTAADGSYFFVGFTPGTYSITESTPPVQYTPEVSNVGTVNGVLDGTSATVATITNVLLATGQSGLNYNFGLIPATVG